MSYLLFTDDNGKPVEVPFDGRIEIGRDSKSFEIYARTKTTVYRLGIADGAVSRKHACIFLESGKVMLQDIGSSIGTQLNGHVLPGWNTHKASEIVEINSDSEILFGYNTKARFVLGERTLTLEEARRLKEESKSPKTAVSPDSASPASDRIPPIPPEIKRPDFIRVISEISHDYCNINVRVRDLGDKFGILNKQLSDKELLNAAVAAERKINAELAPEEFMDEEQVERLRAFCKEFIDMWLLKSQR